MTFKAGKRRLCPLGVLLAFSLLSAGTCRTVRYRIYEEDEPGTVIGTLAEELPLNVPGGFRLMKQFNSSLIRMRESDGQLSTGERIDREQVCGQSPHCALALDVVSFAKEQFRLLHVEVEVRDINDNAPRFPRPQIPLEVSESAAVGTRLPLDIAIDEDVGTNSIQSYQVSVNSHFSLEVQSRADGVKYADLVLVKELDRETQESFNLELVATDGGGVALSGSTVISIQVLDVNDNSPKFDRNAFTVDLMEDAPVGSLLLDLNAEDPDEGVNGQVVYSFNPQVSPEVRELFKIDARTGRLTLEGQVDFETKQTYEFDVQAQDLAPSPLVANCKIIVHITDVNDNAPSITITPLTSITAGVAHITEAASRESFVALISTLDSDSGPNGQVHCSLFGHEHFKLQQAYEDSYMIVTTSALDRERISEYNLTIVAEDLGSPPFKTVRHFTIRVSDENDNPPFFSKPVYEVSVLENNAPGSYITTVVARDPDLGHNGKVTYRLVDTEVMGAPVSTYVSVDPATGSVYSLRTFNYEILKQFDFRIQASDGGSPELSSSALIKVRVLDQNDNAPVITQPHVSNGSAEVEVSARASPGSPVTHIRARDPDEGVNAALSFSMSQEHRDTFTINKVTGEMYVRGDLSHQLGRLYRVLVSVSDSGRPPLVTTVTVNILVTDTAPSASHESAGPWEEESFHWDVPLIVIIVLAGSCTLLLASIIAIATTCRKHRKDPQAQKELPGQRDLSDAESGEQEGDSFIPGQRDGVFEVPSFLPHQSPFKDKEPPACDEASSVEENGEAGSCLYEAKTMLHRTNTASYAPSLHYGKEVAPPVAVWKGNSFNTISTREADIFSGKDSGKGDSDFNDSDSDINGDALKKDIITRMQTGLWACTNECKILGHSDRCWSPTCDRSSSPHSTAIAPGKRSVSTYCKSTSLPRDPHRRDNYYQVGQQPPVNIPKTMGLQSVYEKVLPGEYENRTITLLSPPRPARLANLQDIPVPLYESSGSARYLPSLTGSAESNEL
ncbi:protocadherin-8-like [Ambystoma mexicanum]|uniref:protocadherin-8-like n=1 Tax=Ambystoma mexicanum TaxID=8296 RepID=UPI0037E8A635